MYHKAERVQTERKLPEENEFGSREDDPTIIMWISDRRTRDLFINLKGTLVGRQKRTNSPTLSHKD